ncbi:MAG: tRNA dihydrouridine synthase DusB [Candidatus Cloacimonetes bacterium]|nr:tRNA dihydrouridine synthase DusB [Candidatus Cloacimonadota bacterium]
MNARQLTDRQIWLAPMAGFTDLAFREIAKKCGVGVIVSEMVSADGLIFNREKSLEYARFTKAQRPFGIQLFGSDPEIMRRAVGVVLKEKPDFIDINMGCPVNKVVKRGAGSALMRAPDTAIEIVRAVKSELGDMPLSVKIRSGWDKERINAAEFALQIAEAGADIIVVHPRTRSQMYGGSSDWSLIKDICLKVDVPVVGNGDITNLDSARRMIEETNCDSVMIGRGSVGNPWLFGQIRDFLLTSHPKSLNYYRKIEDVEAHLRLSIEDKGAIRGLKEMRGHLAAYTKGMTGGAAVRRLINSSLDSDEILEAIRTLWINCKI